MPLWGSRSTLCLLCAIPGVFFWEVRWLRSVQSLECSCEIEVVFLPPFIRAEFEKRGEEWGKQDQREICVPTKAAHAPSVEWCSSDVIIGCTSHPAGGTFRNRW